jgi:hypothetical protein
VIHYRLVGEFQGEQKILREIAGGASAPVTDRVEVDLDWDQTTYTIMGKPTVKNTATKITGALKYGEKCPAPRVEGTFEFATVVDVKVMATLLQFDSKSEWPGGAVPSARNQETGTCGEIWNPTEPGSETTTFSLNLPPAVIIAAPSMGGDIEVTPDGKSMLVKASSQTDGWAWTITPTIVK